MQTMQYAMDKYEQRRTALQALAQGLGKGGITRIAERIGKDASYVSRMLYPESKPGFKRMGEDTAEKLSTAFPGWLSTSISHTIDHAGAYIVNHVSKNDADVAHIPHYDTGGAMGHGVTLRDQPGVIREWIVSNEWIAKNIRVITSTNNLIVVTGFGDSMRPVFQPGDPIMVDTGVRGVDHDGIYFFRVGDEGFVKRLQRIPGEGIVAISENKAYRDWTIKPEMDFEVIGRVVKAWVGHDY
jgi:phage repressor protein C with HTH and peptisase S24 domain